MSAYVAIPAFEGDWNNHRHGRRVQCPRCGYGFQSFIPLIDAHCGKCGSRMKVLTGRAPSATADISGRANCPKNGLRNATPRDGNGGVGGSHPAMLESAKSAGFAAPDGAP